MNRVCNLMKFMRLVIKISMDFNLFLWILMNFVEVRLMCNSTSCKFLIFEMVVICVMCDDGGYISQGDGRRW